MEFGDRELNHVWTTCDEVETTRGLIVGTATGLQSPEAALAAFRKRYPGASEDIEKAHVVAWASQSLGLGVRNDRRTARPARPVLAGADRAARARPFRRRLRRQPQLGHGSGDAVGIPRVEAIDKV